MNKYQNKTLFILGIVISIFFAFLFTPVTDSGDYADYINYALKISGASILQDYSNRSPLYPLLMAGLIKIIGISALPRTVIVIQFLLNFFSSLLLFKVLKKLMSPKLSLLSALLFYFNLSSIFYGYMILTETLTVFIFLITVYLFTLWIVHISKLLLILLGIATSLLILVRFNTLPLFFTYLFLIIYAIIKKETDFNYKKNIRQVVYFIIPLFIFLNLYAFYNLKQNKFYGIFSTGGSSVTSRNAILATLDGDEYITEENSTVYKIFLEARDNYYNTKLVEKKGSLLGLFGDDFIKKLYSGYQIYRTAIPQLSKLYEIKSENSQIILSDHLRSFYKEIRSQNSGQLWEMRFYSLLNSFRSSSGITISGSKNLNFNNLPEWSVVVYKLTLLFINLLTFVLVIAYLSISIFNKDYPNPYLLTLILLYLSFYFINFIFGTVGDANRFKFPAEPLIFGLFIYFLNKINDLVGRRTRELIFNQFLKFRKSYL